MLGRTYNEIAGEARSMHKCQGMSQLLPLPAPIGGGFGRGPGGVRAYRLRDTVLAGGVDRAETRDVRRRRHEPARAWRRLRRRAPAGARRPALDRIARAVADARKALAAGGEAAAVRAARRRASRRCATLRASLASMDLSDDAARYEIDFRLAQKEPQFAQALVLAADVRLDAVADDGLVVAGQPVAVRPAGRQSRQDAAVTVGDRANGFGARRAAAATRRRAGAAARRATAARP